jgi:hypothetical protein
MTINLLTSAGGPRPPRVSVLLDFLTRRFTAGTAPWTRPVPLRAHRTGRTGELSGR